MGAVGLMQIMPATAEKIAASLELGFAVRGTPMQSALFDPFVNLTVGIAYLAWLRDKYVGRSPYYLVAAFNIGPAKVDELLSRKSFEPVKTKKYYEDIRKNLPEFRFYDRQENRTKGRV
jgi:soluble lytic murein transglycosylase